MARVDRWDSYNLARYRVQKALETSHVEDSDENSVRKIIPPRRFREEEIQPRRAQQTQHFQEDSESSQDEMSCLRAKKTKKRSRSTPIRPESEEPDEDEVQPITKHTKRSMLPEAPRFPSPSSQLLPHQSISANFQNQEVLEEPCKTVEELEELCEKLKDADLRKKMVVPQHKVEAPWEME
ncbi:unnamed protein product [Leuciscus chuanchicus]